MLVYYSLQNNRKSTTYPKLYLVRYAREKTTMICTQQYSDEPKNAWFCNITKPFYDTVKKIFFIFLCT